MPVPVLPVLPDPVLPVLADPVLSHQPVLSISESRAASRCRP